ncbi:MAG: serine hydrolase [Bacteroidia bacterium]|nr:serine hydrolase [Bacteroidia bacterium]
MLKRYFFFAVILLVYFSCTPPKTPEENLLEKILENRGGVVEQVMQNPEKYRLQMIYTQVDRDSLNRPHFTTTSFRVNEKEYFYPASTVKLPAAILALEKLNKLGTPHLDRNTPMFTDSAYSGQSAVYADSTSETGFPSVGHYIRKIFLVSDNDAFNRLYEFIGQGPFNYGLHTRGFTGTRILHRLDIFLSPDENRHTNPVNFVHEGEKIYWQPLVYNERPVPLPDSIFVGKGDRIDDSVLVMKPKDFTGKNAFPLMDQHRFLQEVMFPGSLDGKPKFFLTEDDYQFLYQAMSELPGESQYPAYDTTHYYDSYVKFLMFGDSKKKMPGNIRVYNKVGAAYGFLIDNAYIVDEEKGIEFFLSAAIYVNEDGIFNDEIYEYDTVAFPFLGELGRAMYEYEVGR